mmetsp:Transcript_43328/g.44017  ORF Transcript_43328/g.44017 Transcript_43328/m.44017 type:complete len:146 (+) Transcript_43328:84-521(+)
MVVVVPAAALENDANEDDPAPTEFTLDPRLDRLLLLVVVVVAVCVVAADATDNDNNNDNNDDDETTTNDKTAEIIVEVEEAEVEWGVSYIGGDPCGSKYNNDPFDASNKSSSTGTGDNNTSSKPGMPDDMKARIQALAEKKLREQ